MGRPAVSELTEYLRATEAPGAINFVGNAYARTATVRPLWMEMVDDVMRQEGAKVYVTLDGVLDEKSEVVTNPDRALAIQWGRIEALSSGSGVDWRVIADRKNRLGTAWELYRLRTSYRLGNKEWGDMKFYMTQNGKFVEVKPNPELWR